MSLAHERPEKHRSIYELNENISEIIAPPGSKSFWNTMEENTEGIN